MKEREGPLEAILVSKDFQNLLLTPEDISEFTPLQVLKFQQEQTVAFHSPIAILKTHLALVWGQIEESLTETNEPILKVKQRKETENS